MRRMVATTVMIAAATFFLLAGVGTVSVQPPGWAATLDTPDATSTGTLQFAFWELGDQRAYEYGFVFTVSVRDTVYTIDPENVGSYDKTSELYMR